MSRLSLQRGEIPNESFAKKRKSRNSVLTMIRVVTLLLIHMTHHEI
jgi:hypothetical protein